MRHPSPPNNGPRQSGALFAAGARGRLISSAAIALGAALLLASSAHAAASSYFTATGAMSDGRASAAAAPLPNGRVLVAGGSDGTDLSSAEVFDPATNSFSSSGIGAMGTARSGAVAAPLPDGRVLVAGGYNGSSVQSSAEVFDPATNSFSASGIGPMGSARYGAVAAPLPDGRVLVAGGTNDSGSYLSSAEVFDPGTNSFSSSGIGAMGSARYGAAAAPLPDGRVLVAGGYYNDGSDHYLSSAEVFDPATNSFSASGIGAMGTAREYAAAAPLPDGRVLVAGGTYNDGTPHYLSSAEVFDPATNTFSSSGIGAMGSPRYGAAAAPLPNGRVLVAGGSDNGVSYLSSAEVFVGAPEPAGAGIDFGTQTVAQPSATQPLAITNLGAQALRIARASLGGAHPGDYAISSDGCRGKVLAFRQSCLILVRFTPAATGARPAALLLTDNAPASPQSFALGGTGVAPNSGPKGDKGDRGPPGPAGRDAKVTCKVKQSKATKKVKVTCKVLLVRASKLTVHWRLVRHHRTYAHGAAVARHGRGVIALRHLSGLPKGRYALRVDGRRAATIRIR